MQTVAVPGTAVNALKSHWYLVDCAALETLGAMAAAGACECFIAGGGALVSLPASTAAGNTGPGCGGGCNARALRSLAEDVASKAADEVHAVPFDPANASRFGLLETDGSGSSARLNLGSTGLAQVMQGGGSRHGRISMRRSPLRPPLRRPPLPTL